MKRLAILAAFALVMGVGTAMAVGIAQLSLLHLAAAVSWGRMRPMDVTARPSARLNRNGPPA